MLSGRCNGLREGSQISPESQSHGHFALRDTLVLPNPTRWEPADLWRRECGLPFPICSPRPSGLLKKVGGISIACSHWSANRVCEPPYWYWSLEQQPCPKAVPGAQWQDWDWVETASVKTGTDECHRVSEQLWGRAPWVILKEPLLLSLVNTVSWREVTVVKGVSHPNLCDILNQGGSFDTSYVSSLVLMSHERVEEVKKWHPSCTRADFYEIFYI